MDIKKYFKSENPEILFVTGDNNTIGMYFKDDEDYVELIVTFDYSWRYGGSGYVTTVNATRSETFDFNLDALTQFYIIDEKRLHFGKSANYRRANRAAGTSEIKTNLFAISDNSFGLSDKLKQVMHPELIDTLSDEAVKEGLSRNKQFLEIETYERNILAQL